LRQKNQRAEGESLVVDLQLGAGIAEKKVMDDSTTNDELNKEEFAIKFDNGYLCYENKLQVIFEKNLIDKLSFSLDNQELNALPIMVEATKNHNDNLITIAETKEHEDKSIETIKGTSKFENVEIDYDV